MTHTQETQMELGLEGVAEQLAAAAAAAGDQVAYEHAVGRAAKFKPASRLVDKVAVDLFHELWGGKEIGVDEGFDRFMRGCQAMFGIVDLEVVLLAYGLAFAHPQGLMVTERQTLTATLLHVFAGDDEA
jgi:hypothetical protein